MGNYKKAVCVLLIAVLALSVAGCENSGNMPKLDPRNPVTITVWHYYNGALLNAFEAAVTEFNETAGTTQGIIVETFGFGHPGDLEQAVVASMNEEIGSMKIPNIFASYADTAYTAERAGLLVDLSLYFTAEEQEQYLQSYIEEGKIGRDGELKIFPVAKATEIMMINETDWQPFADEYNLTVNDLATMEGLARTAELYYNWSGGKAFFGRDSRANMFIAAAKQFGAELFNVESGKATLNIDESVMRKLWDYYYVPFISGYFTSYGRFSSDDMKVGDILAYVGSTASASYFPTEVTTDREVRPVTPLVLPAPLFEGGERVMIQQGAGMVVTNSTPQLEYACVTFLKWFTDVRINIAFSALSGYMPVKNEAIDYDLIVSMSQEAGVTLSPVADVTLRIAIDEIKRSELYTNKAFTGGVEARAVLENHLQSKAVADQQAVQELIAAGMPHKDAVAQYNTDGHFREWYDSITAELSGAIG